MGRSDSHPGLTCPSREFSWRLPPPEWVSRVAPSSLQTCRRHYPGGPVAADCSRRLTPFACEGGGLPPLSPGSASTVPELKERPARRSPTVTAHLLAESPARFVDVESFSRFVPSSTVSTATGGNNQVSRTGLSPAGLRHLCTAHGRL